jgi:hypothetical protein
MKQKYYYLGLILVALILALMSTSCTQYAYGKGCDGNKKMLTAGAGRTKFRK